jgi:hypothetical protein
VYLWCGHWDAAQQVLEQLANHTHWPVLKPFHSTALAMQGALLIGRGDTARGTATILTAQQTMRDERQNVVGSFVACSLADGLIRTERSEEALTVMRNARRDAVHGAEAVLLPELLRVQAEALLASSQANEARAVRLLLRSCRIARRQSALAWELRSATTLARIYVRRGASQQARDLLAPVYDRFTEGLATHDLQIAAQLLQEIDPLAARAAV